MTAERLALVVDDDLLFGQTLARDLTRHDFKTHLAANFADAVTALDQAPQVVVIDLYLGRHSGLELLPLLRERCPTAAVVMMSGYASVPTVVDAMRAGALAFVTKPVTATSILDEIARCQKPLSYETKPSGSQQIPSLVEALEKQNAELLELQRFKDEMSCFIVHDLKNPISVLTANLEYIAEEIVEQATPAIVDAVGSSQIATRRILGLATNILDLIRLESGALSPSRRPIQLAAFLTEITDGRSARRSSQQIKLSMSIEGSPTVTWDEGLITRLIENIMDNAVRYAGVGGRIEITTRNTGETVTIRIGNTGPSIPPAARALVFEKFKRGTPAHAYKTNFGLGLYFCRLVAETHGGRIWIEETTTLPTVFVIELPAS